MHPSISTAIVGALTGSALLAIALFYLRRVPGAPPGIGWWAGAFTLNSLRLGELLTAPAYGAPWSPFLSESMQALSALLLLAGSMRFTGRKLSHTVLAGAAAGVVAWAALTSFIVDDFLLRTLPLYGLSGAAMLFTAALFWRGTHDPQTGQFSRYRLLGVLFALWGVHKLDYPLLRPLDWFAPWGFTIAQVLASAAALGFILAVLHWQQRRSAALIDAWVHAEKALRQSEMRFRDFAGVAADWFWEMDAELRYTFVSERFEAITGVPRDSLVGLDRLELFRRHIEVTPEFIALRERMLHEHVAYQNVEFEWRRSDGTRIRLSSSGKPVYDEHGVFAGYRGIARDVTARHEAEREMRASEARYRSLFDLSPDAIVLHREWRVLDANARAVAMFGARSASDLAGLSLADLITPEHHAAARQRALDAARGDDAVVPLRMTLQRMDGTTLVAEAVGNRVSDEQPPVVQSVFRDLTARLAAERQLQMLSAALQQSPVSVTVTDPDGRIEYVNDAFTEMTGLRQHQALGQFLEAFLGDDDGAMAREIRASVAADRPWSAEVASQRRGGEIYWQHLRASAVHTSDGNLSHIVLVGQDITERKAHEALILQQAHFDALTGLPNRLLATDRVQQAVTSAGRNQHCVALMFVDLDDFKKVNDTMGHEAGDTLLVEVASRLRECVRAEDTVARLGGDEFIIILGGLHSPLEAQPVASKLLTSLVAPIDIDGVEVRVTASLGIASYPEDGADVAALLRHADTAMYQAKSDGGSVHRFFTRSMNERLQRRLQIERHLHRALDDGELRLLYQPICAVADRRVLGLEALLRWRSAAIGDVPPDEFIPIAEQTGLIVPIGDWVLEQGCAAAAGWAKHAGRPLRLAVNVSPRQFRDGAITRTVASLLERVDISACALELEITEGLLMADASAAAEQLTWLRERRVRVCMDDFGTGYSSLSHLKDFPFDTVKVDRSFVRDVAEDAGDAALVSAAIAMARGLGVEVVGEGVETAAQLEFLRQHGCQYAQGYLLGRPVEANEVASVLGSA